GDPSTDGLGGAIMTSAVVTPSIDAEAAAWLARLHAEPDGAAQSALDAWLLEDPEHAAAFERANAIWAILPRAASHDGDEVRRRPSASRPRTLRAAAALAACVSVLAGLGLLWRSLADAGAYATGLG